MGTAATDLDFGVDGARGAGAFDGGTAVATAGEVGVGATTATAVTEAGAGAAFFEDGTARAPITGREGKVCFVDEERRGDERRGDAGAASGVLVVALAGARSEVAADIVVVAIGVALVVVAANFGSSSSSNSSWSYRLPCDAIEEDRVMEATTSEAGVAGAATGDSAIEAAAATAEEEEAMTADVVSASGCIEGTGCHEARGVAAAAAVGEVAAGLVFAGGTCALESSGAFTVKIENAASGATAAAGVATSARGEVGAATGSNDTAGASEASGAGFRDSAIDSAMAAAEGAAIGKSAADRVVALFEVLSAAPSRTTGASSFDGCFSCGDAVAEVETAASMEGENSCSDCSSCT